MPILELAIPLPQTGAPAFEDLMRIHQPQVARTAYRLLGSSHDAQDASQEVFLRLHRHLPTLAPGSNLPAWLYRVTVNVCRDILRRRPPFAAIDRDFAAAAPSPEHLTEHEQRKRIVAEALQYLPPQERECITLHDIEGLSTRDVAIAAGCSEVTVRSHLSSGRARLRAIVERRRS